MRLILPLRISLIRSLQKIKVIFTSKIIYHRTWRWWLWEARRWNVAHLQATPLRRTKLFLRHSNKTGPSLWKR
jgi:hypothetical protein